MADPIKVAGAGQRAFSFMDDAGDAMRAARAAGNVEAEGAIIRNLLRNSPNDPEVMRFLAQMEADVPAGFGDAIPVGMPEAGSDAAQVLGRASDNYEALRSGRMANLRNANPLSGVTGQSMRDAQARAVASRAASQQSDAMAKAGLGGAAALGAGALVGSMAPPMAPPPGAEGLTSTGGTEDLVDESRPAPVVPSEDEEAKFTEMFKRQYLAREAKRAQPDPSSQAKAILDQLNAMRREAGGEVPQAREMMAEANRLLSMSNQQRNAPDYKPANAQSPHSQALMLQQKLNAMRQQAGGEVPEARQMLAEISRLNAMGDQQKWGG